MAAKGKICDVQVQSLELEIERAWVLLGQKRGSCAVRLTRSGRLVGLTPSNKSVDGEDVGTYTQAVSLMELREDVFHVFEEMRRNG